MDAWTRWQPLDKRPQRRPKIAPDPDVVALQHETRLLIDAKTFAKLLRIGIGQIHTLRSSGRLPLPIHLGFGTTIRWSVQELREWFAAGYPPIVVWLRMRGWSGDQRW